MIYAILNKKSTCLYKPANLLHAVFFLKYPRTIKEKYAVKLLELNMMLEMKLCSLTQTSSCSGGHFNPAVSVSVYLIGGLKVVLLIPYIMAQLCGGVIGAGLAKVSQILLV